LVLKICFFSIQQKHKTHISLAETPFFVSPSLPFLAIQSLFSSCGPRQAMPGVDLDAPLSGLDSLRVPWMLMAVGANDG
jgi:hypothetical protein